MRGIIKQSPSDRQYGQPNSIGKKLMFTIWMMSKQESFLSAGDRFDLAKSSAHMIFKNMVQNLTTLVEELIQWPQNRVTTSGNLRQQSTGIPGVVDAIDGCHISIKQPRGNPHDFYSRKGFHSIILQRVCNEKALFIDIDVDRPGRMHDARVFRLSPLYEHINEYALIPENMHIIGASAYPLMVNLMKPLVDNGHLSREQIVHNTKLSSIRLVIERAFGLLKTKFRRLKYLDVQEPDFATGILRITQFYNNAAK